MLVKLLKTDSILLILVAVNTQQSVNQRHQYTE